MKKILVLLFCGGFFVPAFSAPAKSPKPALITKPVKTEVLPAGSIWKGKVDGNFAPSPATTVRLRASAVMPEANVDTALFLGTRNVVIRFIRFV